ncbi:Pentatricopeptide repeat-containing protein [Heracleum sosnowskyi]|uniref:Pentatricopeptide repeat-containing protein n=1 Tax=Heracleum sosnowskyi TaxID=360622 RepID=A0AAD8HSF8_9APIA|nr:Pentatricopeptide repeat-containing protein [Heracleum sosnowskyi]
MPMKQLIPTLSLRQIKQIQAHIITTSKPNTLNILLSNFTHSHTPQNTFFLYNKMVQNPNSHNHFTFTLVLKACSLLHSHSKAQEIHAHVIKNALFSDMFIQNSLIHFYLKQNDIVSSCRVFDCVKYPDVVSWTSIISGLSKCGLENEALIRFSKMNVMPNRTTIVTVLSACISIRAVKIGKCVYCYSLKNFCEDNVVLGNVVLDFFVKFGDLGCARYLFDRMRKRDVVSWTTMVGGFVQRGFFEVAVRVFQEMVQGGEVEPNEATIVSVLSACSSIGDLSLGRWVHSYVSSKDDLVMNRNVGNALVNLYVKCGNMDLAIRVFCMLKVKDVVSWSTMISGLAMNGYGKHVLPLFSLMLIHGDTPDDVTFIGLLSACSHAGLVNQGLMLFKAMDGVYGILPHMKHYACIVDMYGRAGLLEEAERFIENMPVEADGSIWGALLNACNIYGSEEMILRTRQSLSKTRDVTVGTFALLSNTYASSNRWDDANKVRDSMRRMGLKKTAGCSWVEVD